MQILLAGDSTVTEQPWEQVHDPLVCYCGWGQVLHRFLHDDVPVRNFAVSGYTVEMFRDEGKYAALRAALEPGDCVLLQFGHNDQKCAHLRADGGYVRALEAYVHEIRVLGGLPVLVTPVARNSWRGDNGGYCDLLAPYADAVRCLGARLNAPVLDLHGQSVRWICELGLERAKRYFYPGDYTHPNELGALQWVRILAQLVQDSKDNELASLRAALLPEAEWPQEGDVFAGVKMICGWTAAPAPRTDFAPWHAAEAISYAQALEIAQAGYGYFVSVNTQAAFPYLALAAARENGYLPEGYPQEGATLLRPIPGYAFAELMRMACRGRNELPPEAERLAPACEGGVISGEQAARYALALERLATGCDSGAAGTVAPAGS